MEPEISKPNINQEVNHVNYENNVELLPVENKIESGVDGGAEAFEQASELAAAAADSAVSGQLPTLPTPVMPALGDATKSTVSDIGDSPVAANDDDLIEKEWVDKAKKIISETQADPYKREEAVFKLQRDYQKKRYGRELGDV